MKHRLILSMLAATFIGCAVPADAAITVTFTESETDGAVNPPPTITGAPACTATTCMEGVEFSRVFLANYFAVAPAQGFTFAYNLLEPPGPSEPVATLPGVSDQIVFSNFGTTLIITFTSDPQNFITTSYGSTLETGDFQTIPLPSNMPAGTTALTISARSDIESGVPEPATWAMMLIGFGGIGMAMRRRRASDRLPQIA